jgi:hypothetical protein
MARLTRWPVGPGESAAPGAGEVLGEVPEGTSWLAAIDELPPQTQAPLHRRRLAGISEGPTERPEQIAVSDQDVEGPPCRTTDLVGAGSDGEALVESGIHSDHAAQKELEV